MTERHAAPALRERYINFRSLITLDHSTLCIIFKAEPVISDLALRGVRSYPYEPEAQKTRFLIVNKLVRILHFGHCDLLFLNC